MGYFYCPWVFRTEKMTKKATPQAKKLFDKLKQNGVDCILEFNDGHKHIDIHIPKARLNIEVDGLPHYLRAKQIESDLARNYWSTQDDFDTIHIPNMVIEEHLFKLVRALLYVIRKRIK